MFRRGGIVVGIGKLSPWRENSLVTSLLGQLEAFAQAVRGGSSRSLASVVDGLAVMWTIAAVPAGGDEGWKLMSGGMTRRAERAS